MLHTQQKFRNECLEVYDVIFDLIQWRLKNWEKFVMTSTV